MKIGEWVRLKRPGRRWHLVESVIAGDAVTKCGRRFPDPSFDTSTVMVLTRMIGQPQNCRYCDRGAA
jgi:hypothetical protein